MEKGGVSYFFCRYSTLVRRVLLLGAVLLFGGCGSPVSVATAFDEKVELTSYRSFAMLLPMTNLCLI